MNPSPCVDLPERSAAIAHPASLLRHGLLTLSLTLVAAPALALPALAHSRPVTLAQLKDYGGDGAYLAVYLTDAQGAYPGTLWVAGGKAK